MSVANPTPRDSTLSAQRDKLFHQGSSFEKVHRSDIVGIDPILDRIDEVIDWLRNFQLYRKYDTRLEPGIVFEGVPGSGKTLCSRYIATESNALFISLRDYPVKNKTISADEIKDVFERARSHYDKTETPIVLFWDEFEVVARSRGQAKDPAERTTASELTAQLDGINGKCPGLLIIGCTNYFRQIDEALLRPGRMGLHFHFSAPDRKGKKILLDHYLQKRPQQNELDIETPSYFFKEDDTAAKVEEVSEKIWRKVVTNAIKAGRDPQITSKEMAEVVMDDFLGMPPTHTDLSLKAKKNIAVHELGHALVAYRLGVDIRVVTLRPDAQSYGRVIIAKPDFHYSDSEEIRDQIVVAVASIESERVCGLPPSSHSDNDTQAATDMARRISEAWGAGGKGIPFNPAGLATRRESTSGDTISAETLTALDFWVIDTLSNAQDQARDILSDYGTDTILQLADRLVEEETWTGSEFKRIMDGL